MPAQDSFKSFTPAMGDPISQAVVITPNDTEDLPWLTRALYIGTPGDIHLGLSDGSTVVFHAMVAGWHPLRAARVYATQTNAANIIGCW